MTRLLMTTAALFAGLPAQAHIGHVGEAAGHDHWVAGIAIGVAIGVSIWAGIKGKTDEDPDAEEAEEASEEEPA